MIIFVLLVCSTLYFDDHFHSYAISVTSTKLLVSDLYDIHVYHAHRLSDGLYIPLRYHFTM